MTPRTASPFLLLMLATALAAAPPPRARDLGVPFEGRPGTFNAITDVAGVEVGHTTLVSGDGPLVPGKGPVRTGVTAILPRGRTYDPVFAATTALNGAGEMTGAWWIEEGGFLETPFCITNTHSVGAVSEGMIQWLVKHRLSNPEDASLPAVAETYDGYLNDISGFHVRQAHAAAALDGARSGPVAEGGVGGGTGMVCHQFKGGIGTASRVLPKEDGGWTVGVLLQANHGRRSTLTIAGVPVGREIPDLMPDIRSLLPGKDSSVIAVVATDAPLLPHQLKRLARRVSLGLARVGTVATNGSGEIFLAFSTANPGAHAGRAPKLAALANEALDPIFEAVVQATEEAVVNAMVAGRTVTGINGNTVHGLPHDRLRQALAKYNRLAPVKAPAAP